MTDIKSLIREDLVVGKVGGIPICFEDNASTIKGWQMEAVVLLQQFAALSQALLSQAQAPGVLRTTRQRLKHHAKACEEQASCLMKVLMPLDPAGVHPVELQSFLQTSGHRPSSLGQYVPNLFRDWTWGERENAQNFELLKSLLPDGQKGSVLFMGAGGGRLAYDFHRWAKPSLTLANDVNPLLLLVAKQMAEGKMVELYEMPPIPVDEKSSAVKQSLVAPAKTDENLQFLLGDSTTEIFRAGTFDSVVTQWFIDDCGRDIHKLFPRINRLLKPGGAWVNIGPLIYRAGFAGLYSATETIQIAQKCGFEVEQVKNEFMPYLHSPLWRNYRDDMVLSFRAVKKEECEKAIDEGEAIRPASFEWLSDKTKPIPILGNVRSAAQAFSLMATVFENIDGSTSIETIENRIVHKLGIPAPVASRIVTDLLRGMANAKSANPMKST